MEFANAIKTNRNPGVWGTRGFFVRGDPQN
jgi:hypothetical protein